MFLPCINKVYVCMYGSQESHELGELEDIFSFFANTSFLAERYAARDRFSFSSIIL